ncbi:hypothetical protein L3Y34_014318 [Caenorhabditis briggsae]|uniref:Uncharacterized protein n=1 Tax=Caenorhabditis briggsae TaxID=6238 RepID=A0AAE9DSD2_CAEBR|nr:hypothetical protein L3Y34_014318 [Caenorhabditis briggsae]
MGKFPFLGLLIIVGFHVTYSTQCDCNSSCSIYTSPVQCVRCCTHYVKRSLPLHPAHHKKRQFLLDNLLETPRNRKIKKPVWREKEEQDPVQSTLPRFIRLLLKNPL